MGLYLNDEADGECRGGVAEVRPDVRPDFVVSPDGGGVRLVAVGIAQLALDLVRLLLPLDAQQEAVGAIKLISDEGLSGTRAAMRDSRNLLHHRPIIK